MLPSGLLHLRLSVYRRKDPSGSSIAFMFSISKTKGMISILVLIQCTFPHYSQFVYMYAHSLCTALKGTPLLASGTVFWALVSQLTVFSVSGNANSIVCLSLLALPLLMPWGRSYGQWGSCPSQTHDRDCAAAFVPPSLGSALFWQSAQLCIPFFAGHWL